MQDGEETDLRPQMFGIGGDGLERFRRGLEENAVDHPRILEGDGGDLFRHGEHHVKIGNVEQLGLPVLDPFRPCQGLAFGTVAVPAAVERIAFIAALIALFEMAAESGGAAALDGVMTRRCATGRSCCWR